jgi:copper chaperone CopZ
MNISSYIHLYLSYLKIKRRIFMKKTYKINVDCASCAEKMQEAIKNTEGIKDATVSFMTLKCKVEFNDDVDYNKVIKEARNNCKKVESDCEIFI